MLNSVLAVILSGFAAQATPSLEFHAINTRLSAHQTASVIIRNTSDAPALNVEMTLTFPESVELVSPLQTTSAGWRCVQFSRSASCVAEEVPPGSVTTVNFVLRATSIHVAGEATATLAAKDIGLVGAIRFTVSPHQAYHVNTVQDFVPGSLRDAIEWANANPFCGTEMRCTISFELPGPEPTTIAPLAPLPPIRKCNVILAGPDEFDLRYFTKLIAISGENVGFGNGLEVRASCAAGVPGVRLESIVVHSWPWNGIYFEAPEAHADPDFAGHEVVHVYVGTDPAGKVAKPNLSRGIVTDSPHEVVSIGSCIASGNGRSGIAFFRGKRGTVTGTKMGVGIDGRPLGNGAGGFFSFGVPFTLFHNTIAYNNFSGIAVTAGTPKAAMFDNRIHSNGNVPIDWGLNNRSRDDDDESDGIINAPRVLDAFYDAFSNLTRVRGTVRLTAGAFSGQFRVQIYVASTRRGDVVEPAPQTIQPVAAPASGTADVSFELVIPGDFRGKMIALQTNSWGPAGPEVSSEISEALPVR